MEQANSDYINELSGDNTEFRKKIIDILKRELPEEVTAYYDQIQNKNFLLAAGCVHKLKHKISILGLKKSYYIAEHFEDNLKDNSIELKSDFDDIIKIMQDFVDKL
jgi:HPt (histidine-containing phosphotransfer) domain-containing protein|nr:Hpt domain-containing protein [uncultured Flavobacterium sp.]